MKSEDPAVDKSSQTIERMFSAVAPRYDLLNRVLSANLDQGWRRQAAASLKLPDGAPVLDVCAGTGDQALALRRRTPRVLAADFSVPMLRIASRKFRQAQAPSPVGFASDTLQLPLPSKSLAAVTVSFGLRNVADLDAALREMHRVLQNDGETAILEFTLPRSDFLRRPYWFYFRHILPRIGGWLSPRGSAYTYLPESVTHFPQRQEFTQRMEDAGFRDATWRELTGGIVCLYTGRRDS
jgi:demethylmenaquinone methyltransferase/2-methoxy-6-polyprenyl-1,4-benzoquinol methylase